MVENNSIQTPLDFAWGNEVQDLFLSAARLRENGKWLFPRKANNHLRPGEVRKVFGLSEHDYSNWRRDGWRAAEKTKQIEISQTLLSIFVGSNHARVKRKDRLRADSVLAHWRNLPATKTVIEELQKYLQHLETTVALGGRERRRADTKRSEWITPADLSPPPLMVGARRPGCISDLQAIAGTFLAIIIQGKPDCGKSYLARELMDGLPPGRRALWYNLVPGLHFGNLASRLATLPVPLNVRSGQETADLVAWLQAEDAVLVLDGFNRENVFSFAPLLQVCARLPAPCRIVATSAIKIDGQNAYDVPKMSPEEVEDFLKELQVSSDENEIRKATLEMDVWPYAVRKALAIYGVVNPTSLVNAARIHDSELAEKLPLADRRVVEVLRFIDADIDFAALGEILAALGHGDTPDIVAKRLWSAFLLRQVSEAAWRLESRSLPDTRRWVSQTEMAGVLERVALNFKERLPTRGGVPQKLSVGDLANAAGACRMLQLANGDVVERQRLLSAISGPMERQAFHSQLVRLYKHEARHEGRNPGWMAFKYARSLYVTGELRQTLEELDRLFHELVRQKEARDENLYISVLRSLAEVLIDVGRSDLALQILDGALERAEIAEMAAKVVVQTVSVFTWALLKSGMPAECILVNDDILDRRFSGLALPFSRAISQIRVGAALIVQGDAPKAIPLLEKANTYFATEDVRAYAWSALHLSLGYRSASRTAEAADALRKAIETNASRSLFGAEQAAAYQLFLSSEEFADLHPGIKSELKRVESYELMRAEVAAAIPDSRFVEHALLETGRDEGSPYEFEIDKYELFSVNEPFAIRSKFNQSLINNLRKENIENILDDLFENRTIEYIFRMHIYNRIIINASKDSPVLAKKYIYPHLSVVSNQVDGVLFAYARYFEGVGDLPSALTLLERTRNRDCFNYFNIAANCASRDNFDEAMSLNEKALSHARGRQQKAQILHNQAQLIYSHNVRVRFEEAKAICERSIRNTTKPRFVWPKNLLLKLNLLTAEESDIPLVLKAHQERFRLSDASLEKICLELDGGKAKRVSLAAVRATRNPQSN